MKIVRTVAEIQKQTDNWRRQGLTLAVVPTMGYLHEGHLSLMRRAVQCCDKVIATLFVNPMQFGPGEDLDAYPRDFERDCLLSEKEGVDILFCPKPDEMYGDNFQTAVSVGILSQGLCGADRPGHFDGVATVVTKLFNIVRPHIAVFGQKDYQQLALIRQLVQDLNFDIEIIGHPIVRETDGLAMSSRNKYLDTHERTIATCLYKAIQAAKKKYQSCVGEVTATELVKLASSIIEVNPECQIDYVSIVNEVTLKPVEIVDDESVILLAVKISGKVRLIDNAPLCEIH